MGKIEIDHTGANAGITLSSDGTDLLLDGTAIGGGGTALELYAENPVNPTAPVATGTNGVAIGAFSSSTGNSALALGNGTGASYAFTLAAGYNAQASSQFGATALTNSYASGSYSFAAAIANNTSSYGATGANSVAMGSLSKAGGADSVAIGDSNLANNASAVSIGASNTASGSSSVVFGTSHTASGYGSACIGGSTSTASNTYSMTFGPYAKASVDNAFIFGSKGFFSAGSVQSGKYILYSDTTNATAEALTTTNAAAGNANQVILPNNSAFAFSGTIVARQQASTGTASAAWKVEGLIRREGSAGTTVLVNSATTVLDNTPAWGMALTADTTNGGLAITVTGAAGTNIRWVATINTSEVTY